MEMLSHLRRQLDTTFSCPQNTKFHASPDDEGVTNAGSMDGSGAGAGISGGDCVIAGPSSAMDTPHTSRSAVVAIH